MKWKNTQIKTKLTAWLLAVALVLTMVPAISPAAEAYGANGEYGFQPEGADDTANSLKLWTQKDEPSVAYQTVEYIMDDDQCYLNEIKESLDGMKQIKFAFTMSAGMNNFTESWFLEKNMSKIQVCDENKQDVPIEYNNGTGKLEYLGSQKTSEINNHGTPKTDRIFIGLPAETLSSGTYLLVFGKEICGNNKEKILGKDIKFKFHVKAAPELAEMIKQAKDFLSKATINDDATKPDTYPTSARDKLDAAIKTAEEAQQTIDADASMTADQKKKAKEEASNTLYEALRAFKETRHVIVDGLSISGIKKEVYVGDSGTASAAVTVRPDEDQYKRVKWSSSQNVDIDEASGAWQANYAGPATITATSQKDTSKSATFNFTITTEPGVTTVNLNGKNVRLQTMVEKALASGETAASIKALKVFTSKDGLLTAEDLTYIKEKMTSLESLNLKNAAIADAKLPGSVFAGKTSLKKVELPDTLSVIDAGAFRNCSSLSDIQLPAGLTSIGSGAFAGCTSLPSELTIWAVCPPKYVTTGTFGSAFNGISGKDPATSVKAIRVPYSCEADYRNEPGWRSFSTITPMKQEVLKVNFTASGTLQQAAQNALNARGLKEEQVSDLVITSPGSVQLSRSEDINGYLQKHFLYTTTLDLSGTQFEDNKCNANTFKDRISLKHIKLPDTTTTIGGTCFAGCKNLREMVLPSSLGNMGSGAFNGCEKMGSRIVVEAVTPPTYSGTVFPSCINTIIVPPQSVEAYKKATGWSQYRNNIISQITLSLSASSMTLQAPATASLTAAPGKYGGNPDDVTVRWSTSNASVVSVSPSVGKQTTLTANKPGTATITAQDATGYVTAACTVTVTGLAAPTVKAAAAGYNRANVTWSAVSGASGYEVYRATKKNGAYQKIRTLSASTRKCPDAGLYTGTTYYYKVRAYKSSVRGSYSNAAAVKPTLAKVSGLKVKAVKAKKGKAKKSSAGKANVSWKKVNGASGYTIYRSLKKKKGYKAIKSVKGPSKRSWTVGKLKKGKKYYFKVRAYRTIKGKKVYGAYSNAVAYKVKK